MKTKVCPCCDQPINGMYCKGCRKIVLKPVEQEIKYFLNQRHPEFETDCSFHGNTAAARSSAEKRTITSGSSAVRDADHRMTTSESEAKKAEIRERMAARKREQQNTPKQAAKSPKRDRIDFGSSHGTILNGENAKRGRTAKTSSAAKKIIIGIAIYLLINIIGVFGIVFNQLSDVFDSFDIGMATPEPDIAIENFTPFEEGFSPAPEEDLPVPDLEDWELTDAEVKAAGAACTGYGHFDVFFEESLKTEFLECLKEDELFCREEEPYSYNSQMEFASWYQTVYGFAVETESEYIGMVEIETDTATRQIHGISVYTSETDRFIPLLDSVLGFMETVGLTEGVVSGEEFFRILMEKENDGDVVLMYGVEVDLYVDAEDEDSPFYSISMSAPRDMTVVE